MPTDYMDRECGSISKHPALRKEEKKKQKSEKISEQNRKVMAQRNEMTVAKSFPYFYLLCARVVRFYFYTDRERNGESKRKRNFNANEWNDMNKLYECGQAEEKLKVATTLIGGVCAHSMVLDCSINLMLIAHLCLCSNEKNARKKRTKAGEKAKHIERKRASKWGWRVDAQAHAKAQMRACACHLLNSKR